MDILLWYALLITFSTHYILKFIRIDKTFLEPIFINQTYTNY